MMIAMKVTTLIGTVLATVTPRRKKMMLTAQIAIKKNNPST